MLNHRSARSLRPHELIDSRVLGLWLYPSSAPLQPISSKEKAYACQLPIKRARQYKHSRGYVRHALSQLSGIPPLDIPLEASPGLPPSLPRRWGFISFSHCCDGLLVGWSSKKIGVDLERTDRTFAATKLVNRYFTSEEKAEINTLKQTTLHAAVLEYWIAKEAAIKWQKGSIAKDISQWKWAPKSQMAFHQSLKFQIKIHPFRFKQWSIAIALSKESTNKLPVLCID